MMMSLCGKCPSVIKRCSDKRDCSDDTPDQECDHDIVAWTHSGQKDASTNPNGEAQVSRGLQAR